MATNILMPALSPTMEEGTLTKWLKKEGDAVKAGDVIAEIETDKATMEVEAVDEGTLAKILIADGTENVKVNTPIAVLTEEGEAAPPPSPGSAGATSPASGGGNRSAPEAKNMRTDQAAKSDEARQPVSSPVSEANGGGGPRSGGGGEPQAPKPASSGDRIFASPLAKRIAADGKLDLKLIVGTGPGGRIVKADVEKALAEGPPKPKAAEAKPGAPPAKPTPAAQPAPAGALPDARLFYKEGTYRAVAHDSMRKTVAKRLTVAKREIPHYYLTADIEIDALLSARETINAKSPKDGDGAYKVSVNDFVVKAAAAALMKVPDVNASWTETEMLLHQHADIGIAVALPGGLITPIIFAAETKGLVQISREAKDLAARAKAKKLKPAEYEGGSFSVSNLGMYGMRNFTAVINPPQASILAVGAGEKRPVVRGDRLEIATVMTVTMSCDHRVIDGALGATWLKALKEFLEDPVTMLA